MGYFLPWTTQKIKIKKEKKKEKKPGDIIILHMCTKNYDHMMYSSQDIVHEARTDGWKKWHIEVGTSPKNNNKENDVYNKSGIKFDSAGSWSFDNDLLKLL